MELSETKEGIEFKKELNDLDKLVIDFVKVLDDSEVRYAIVSGYVAILFGRSRSSEDIDIIIESIGKNKFGIVWEGLSKKFECIITANREDAYNTYLSVSHPVRFSRKGKFIPNIEVKFPKVELDEWTLGNRKRVLLNGKILYISPMELQIPFKLFLGSDKDIEDAKHLYNIFKNNINMNLLRQFLKKLNKEEIFN